MIKRSAVAFFLLAALLSLPALAQAQSHSVTLNWNAGAITSTASAATSFQVWRGTAAGGETLLTTAGTGGNVGLVTTYTDTTVVAGTTYFYEVFALNSFGPSGPSNEASAAIPTAPTGGKPNAPSITITVTIPTT
jgi:hypothetical protein